YAACGAIRLARFNVIAHAESGTQRYFIGLPIPLAAGMLVSLVIALNNLEAPVSEAVGLWPIATLVLVLAFLMVSTIRYRTFKEAGLNPRTLLVFLLITVVGVAVAIRGRPSLVLLVYFSIYILLGLAEEALFGRRRRAAARAGHRGDRRRDSAVVGALVRSRLALSRRDRRRRADRDRGGRPGGAVLRGPRFRPHRHRRGRRVSRHHGVPAPHALCRARGLRPLSHLRRAQALAGAILRPRAALEERGRRGARRSVRRTLGAAPHLGCGGGEGTAARTMSTAVVEFLVTGDEVMRGLMADTNTQ